MGITIEDVIRGERAQAETPSGGEIQQMEERFMNRTLKMLICVTLAAALLASSALACTGYYVGKDASVNGTYIIGHTVDAWNTAQAKQVVYPHTEEAGRTVTVGENQVPLPEVTYQYTSTPFIEGLWDNAVANEMGLTMTGSVTTYISGGIREMDPYTQDGASEQWISGYIAATSANAREAIENYGKIMEEYGSSESNTFMIADQNEAWYLESYSGHQWCAVKMPDDCVAVFGNECMLGTVEAYTEGEMLLHSEGLFTAPEEAGLAVYDDNGNMDLFATYCGADNLNAGANRRTWYGHVLMAPSTAGDYNVRTRYDLFYQPDEKVSLSDVFELTRSRFEGTEWNPEDTGRPDIRVIGIERQVNCAAIEVYPQYPAAMSAVTWTCVANAEHSVYLPLSNLITDVAEKYDYTPEGFTSDSYGLNLDYAHTHFKRLCALAEQDREHYGTGVRAYWKSVEDALIAEYPSVLEETAKLYAEDPAKAAEYVTNYTIEKQEKALADCDLMYDELTWYMIANTSTMRYSNGEFSRWDNFVPSIAAVEEAE